MLSGHVPLSDAVAAAGALAATTLGDGTTEARIDGEAAGLAAGEEATAADATGEAAVAVVPVAAPTAGVGAPPADGADEVAAGADEQPATSATATSDNAKRSLPERCIRARTPW